MIVLREPPPPESDTLAALYRRMAQEGMAHSSLMRNERYDRAASFDDTLACAALTWSAGGEERYEFDCKRAVTVKSAGALSLRAGDRYAYAAKGDGPFLSNMIVFPKWITEQAAIDPLTMRLRDRRRMETRLFRPSQSMERFMGAFVASCRQGDFDETGADEALAQLYEMTLADQSPATGPLHAQKSGTRAELRRRVARARDFLLQSYDDERVNIGAIAREACLSPYHLIRVFGAVVGETPMQYLQRIRMDAARRLLVDMKRSVSETAAAVGYSNRSAFYRAFRKHFGISPSSLARASAR